MSRLRTPAEKTILGTTKVMPIFPALSYYAFRKDLSFDDSNSGVRRVGAETIRNAKLLGEREV